MPIRMDKVCKGARLAVVEARLVPLESVAYWRRSLSLIQASQKHIGEGDSRSREIPGSYYQAALE